MTDTERIITMKLKQNFVFFVDPPTKAFDISARAGNMLINRFCIDEDAANELSGVYHLEKAFGKIIFGKFIFGKNSKGKDN